MLPETEAFVGIFMHFPQTIDIDSELSIAHVVDLFTSALERQKRQIKLTQNNIKHLSS